MTAFPQISKFPQIEQADAAGELAQIYDDMQSTLRFPEVPFAIRVMSQFPAFVPAAWQMLKPQISTLYAERGADLVRDASVIPGPPPPDPAPSCAPRGGPRRRSARSARCSISSPTAAPRASS